MTPAPPADPNRPSLRYWIKAGFGIGIGLRLFWLALSLIATVVVAVLPGFWSQPFIGSLMPFNAGGPVQVVLWVAVAALAAWLFARRIMGKR